MACLEWGEGGGLECLAQCFEYVEAANFDHIYTTPAPVKAGIISRRGLRSVVVFAR